MTEQISADFQQRLTRAEETRDVAPLVDLFSDDAEIASAVSERAHRGRRGVEKFWQEYLGSFREVHSHFTGEVEHDGRVALEWETDGTLPNGRPIHYRGVSILETREGKVKGFRTYYDSAPFLAPRQALA